MEAKFDGTRITSSLAGTWLLVASSSSCDCGDHKTKYEVVPETERKYDDMHDLDRYAESRIFRDREAIRSVSIEKPFGT